MKKILVFSGKAKDFTIFIKSLFEIEKVLNSQRNEQNTLANFLKNNQNIQQKLLTSEMHYVIMQYK